MIFVEKWQRLPFDLGEALRYLGCKEGDGELLSRIEEVRCECEIVLRPAVCYTLLPIQRDGEKLQLGSIVTTSQNLSAALEGCENALLFAATLGVGIDRLLISYGQTNALKAALVQGVATAYVETLCDEFCNRIQREQNVVLGRRFSAGYGDLPLQLQRDIFALLTPERQIGVTLNQSLLMSPSKSVTAFVGIGKGEKISRCEGCSQENCNFQQTKLE